MWVELANDNTVYHGNQPVDGWKEWHLQCNQYSYNTTTRINYKI